MEFVAMTKIKLIDAHPRYSWRGNRIGGVVIARHGRNEVGRCGWAGNLGRGEAVKTVEAQLTHGYGEGGWEWEEQSV